MTPQDFLEKHGRYLTVELDGELVTFDLQLYTRIDRLAAERQLAEASELVAYWGGLLDTARDRLKTAVRERHVAKGAADTLAREDITAEGGKPTDKAAEARVRVNPTVTEAVRYSDKMESLVERLERIYWTLKERRESLEVLARGNYAERSGPRQ